MEELRAVHTQLVAMAMDPLAPDAAIEALDGLMATEQFCPGWVTTTVRLFIKMFPVRAVAFGFAAME